MNGSYNPALDHSYQLIRQQERDRDFYELGAAISLLKEAATPETSRALSGQLYLSNSGWLLLSVPNALGRGAFEALDENGVELPLSPGGHYNAHISVMRAEEVEKIGGPNRIVERGKHFHYTLGPTKTVDVGSKWDEMSKAWYIEVSSPELAELRRSYGLSSLPDGDIDFHITFAVRRKRVLQEGVVVRQPDQATPAKRTTQDWMSKLFPSFRKAAEIEYDPDEHCPSCGDHYVVRCRCRRGNMSCKNGHSWHRCRVCDRIVSGDGHGTPFDQCSCPSDKQAAERHPFTVAVDLDGTILEDGKPPDYGKVRDGVRDKLKAWKKKGWRLLIFTVRGDNEATAKYLRDNDVPFDYVNYNPDQPPGASGKLIADCYVDDRAVNAKRDWEAIAADVDKAHGMYKSAATIDALFGKDAHILVTGYSGSGKTTIAKQLSQMTGLPLVSLDEHRDSAWKRIFKTFAGDSKDPNHPSHIRGTADNKKLDQLAVALASDALKMPQLSIIEGTQLLRLPAQARSGHTSVLVDAPEEQVIEQRLNRDRKKGKFGDLPAGTPLEQTRRQLAQALINQIKPEYEAWKTDPGTKVVAPGAKLDAILGASGAGRQVKMASERTCPQCKSKHTTCLDYTSGRYECRACGQPYSALREDEL